MPTRPDLIARLTQAGIIAIVRAPRAAQVEPLFGALLAGGLNAIEITLTTPNALEAIREARAKIGARAVTGVGTVLQAEDCRAALAAGAEFVGTPVCRPVSYTHLRAHETPEHLVCRLLLEKKNNDESQNT